MVQSAAIVCLDSHYAPLFIPSSFTWLVRMSPDAVVGEEKDFEVLDDEKVQPYVSTLLLVYCSHNFTLLYP